MARQMMEKEEAPRVTQASTPEQQQVKPVKKGRLKWWILAIILVIAVGVGLYLLLF